MNNIGNFAYFTHTSESWICIFWDWGLKCHIKIAVGAGFAELLTCGGDCSLSVCLCSCVRACVCACMRIIPSPLQPAHGECVPCSQHSDHCLMTSCWLHYQSYQHCCGLHLQHTHTRKHTHIHGNHPSNMILCIQMQTCHKKMGTYSYMLHTCT